MLHKPLRIGSLSLKHRVVLAPLTRFRSTPESDGIYLPNEMNVQYYEQRASPGSLMLTEATPISRTASGYPGIPGIFTKSQVKGWKKVTQAVHSRDAYIFCQLWHVGRATVPSLTGGVPALSSTNVPLSGTALDGTDFATAPPRAMSLDDIQHVITEYANAARNAKEADFDGVEIHGANGYLIEQFLHDNVNQRSDQYGGSTENRCRFVLEVIEAVTRVMGADRVGVRLSPYNCYQDTKDSNRTKHWVFLCEQIAALPETARPAYVHMAESVLDYPVGEKKEAEADFSTYVKSSHDTDAVRELTPRGNWLKPYREPLKRAGIMFIAAGNFDRTKAMAKLDSGEADAIAFGRFFISNPDLPYRLQQGLPLNPYDQNTFYTADPPTKGYTDYPRYQTVV